MFDENGNCENKFICIETVTTLVGTNGDQSQTTIKIYSVPIYDYRHDTYVHRDAESYISDVRFINSSRSLITKKYPHIDDYKSNFTTIVDIFKSIAYVKPAEIKTLSSKKLLIHSDHHFLPPSLSETELRNFIRNNWSQIYNSDYNYEFFFINNAYVDVIREVHNVKVERNTVTDKYRYTTTGKSKSDITPEIYIDSTDHGPVMATVIKKMLTAREDLYNDYTGYKLTANSNKIVGAGNHTLSGHTGYNVTLSINGNAVSVKTAKHWSTDLNDWLIS